jgi:hypothetical protein
MHGADYHAWHVESPTPATRDDFMDPVPAEKEHGTDTLQQKRADRWNLAGVAACWCYDNLTDEHREWGSAIYTPYSSYSRSGQHHYYKLSVHKKATTIRRLILEFALQASTDKLHMLKSQEHDFEHRIAARHQGICFFSGRISAQKPWSGASCQYIRRDISAGCRWIQNKTQPLIFRLIESSRKRDKVPTNAKYAKSLSLPQTENRQEKQKEAEETPAAAIRRSCTASKQ